MRNAPSTILTSVNDFDTRVSHTILQEVFIMSLQQFKRLAGPALIASGLL